MSCSGELSNNVIIKLQPSPDAFGVSLKLAAEQGSKRTFFRHDLETVKVCDKKGDRNYGRKISCIDSLSDENEEE